MKKTYSYILFLIFAFSTSYLQAQKVKSVFKLIDKQQFQKAAEKLHKLLLENEEDALLNLAKVEILSLDFRKNIKESIVLLDKYHHKLENYQGNLEAKYGIQKRYQKTWEKIMDYIVQSSDPNLAEFYFNHLKASKPNPQIQAMLQKEVLKKLQEAVGTVMFRTILHQYPHFQPDSQAREIAINLEFKELNKKHIQALKDFIETYPIHPLKDSAQYIIYTLALEDVKQKDNLASYEHFFKTYPNAPQEILQKVKDLKFYNKNYLMGKFKPSEHEYFIEIDSKYRLYKKARIYLHKETYVAFIEMAKEAQEAGITLKILSGTRSFWSQKYIWERNWKKHKQLSPIQKARKILEYSSMPGTSRHHWGTDIDINSVNPAYFDKAKGQKEYEWLVNNAHKFGFFQTFDGENSGYKEEKWHWSYRPIAAKCLDFYNQRITYQDISGYLGADMAKEVEVIKYFVQQIANP